MNVVGSRADGWWRDRRGAMRRLAAELADYARRSGDDVTVVFDGRPFDLPTDTTEALHVVFAPRSGRDAADDEIARMVRADGEPSGLVVVTSDSGLAQRVRDAGAQVVSARTFDRRLRVRG